MGRWRGRAVGSAPVPPDAPISDLAPGPELPFERISHSLQGQRHSAVVDEWNCNGSGVESRLRAPVVAAPQRVVPGPPHVWRCAIVGVMPQRVTQPALRNRIPKKREVDSCAELPGLKDVPLALGMSR